MASIYTEAELIAKIKALDVKIEAAEDVSNYNISTGMGSQAVTKRSLSEMYRRRKELLAELAEVTGDGLMSLGMER